MARARSAAGSALIELAVTLPVLVLSLAGAADFARVFYYAMELTSAARAGAQYAAYNDTRAQVGADIKTAAQTAAANISPITVSIGGGAGCPPDDAEEPRVCTCARDDGTGQPWPVVACNSTCASGSHLTERITVTASKTFTTISPLPGIPHTLTLCRTATLRVGL
jgi:Flp pilus assembly protein TadG